MANKTILHTIWKLYIANYKSKLDQKCMDYIKFVARGVPRLYVRLINKLINK